MKNDKVFAWIPRAVDLRLPISMLEEAGAAALRSAAEHMHRQAEEIALEARRGAQEYTQKIDQQVLETRRRLGYIFGSFGKIGGFGWTVSEDMPFPVVAQLADCSETSQADAVVLQWYEADDPQLAGLEKELLSVSELAPFHFVLGQAFSAYRLGLFAVTIPLLIGVLEQALRLLGDRGDSTSTDIPKVLRKTLKNVRKRKGDSVSPLESVHAFTESLYQTYTVGGSERASIRRKGIMHGLQVPSNQKIDVIRLFHVLKTVSDLYAQD